MRDEIKLHESIDLDLSVSVIVFHRAHGRDPIGAEVLKALLAPLHRHWASSWLPSAHVDLHGCAGTLASPSTHLAWKMDSEHNVVLIATGGDIGALLSKRCLPLPWFGQ